MSFIFVFLFDTFTSEKIVTKNKKYEFRKFLRCWNDMSDDYFGEKVKYEN